MANQLTIKLPAVPMRGDTDVVFKIKIDGLTFGNLTVTRESLIWHSAKIVPRGTVAVSWMEFDEWMRARESLKD